MIDELETLLENVDFELQHFGNKKHMKMAARQRILKQVLSVDYEMEFCQFLSTFHGEHMGLKEFEADRIAFQSVRHNIAFDLNELKQTRRVAA